MGHWYSHLTFITKSRNMALCCVAHETQGAQQTRVYFTGVRKTLFTRICSSTLPEQKHTKFSVRMYSKWGTFSFKFERNLPIHSQDMRLKIGLIFFGFFFFFFSQHFWHCYNLHLLWWITLKFRALLDHIRAYLKFNFCSNRIKKQRVIVNFQNFQVRSFVTPTSETTSLKWLKIDLLLD